MRFALPILLFLFLIAHHLTLVSLAGYPLTVGALAGLGAVAMVVKRPINWSPVVPIICAVGSLAILNVLWVGSAATSTAEFVRTSALVVLGLLVLAATFQRQHVALLMGRGPRVALFSALITVVAVSTAQVVAGSAGQDTFFNPWGERQYLYQYDPHLEYAQFPRAAGFYLEPSYNAFVIGSLGVALFAMRYRPLATLVLTTVGMVATLSVTGLILLAALLLIAIVKNTGSSPVLPLLAVASLGFFSLPYLQDRLWSAGTLGSSANYRFVAPVQVLEATLASAPLGQPLGSIQQTLSSYRLLNGETLGTSLDNGYYVLIFYLGWLGVALIAFAAGYVAVLALRPRRSVQDAYAWVVPVWAFASLAFSGGIVLPEYLIMIWLLGSAYQGAVRLSKPAPSSRPAEESRGLVR